jgi:hypothetical protein
VSLLFDTFEQESNQRNKSGRQKTPSRQKPASQNQEPKKVFIHAAIVAPAPLGRLDGSVACLDRTCQAQCHDITDEDRGQWRLECCFCGTGQWVPVVPGHLPPPAEGADFVLRGGRFDGQTLGEVARSSRGMDYIAWAAKEHPRPAVAKSCENYLASLAANR